MTNLTHQRSTLVLGGTGKTGRRIVERLTRRDMPVRIGSRSSGLPFDWDEPATWRPVLQDVEAAYIAYWPDIAAPGATDTVGAFVAFVLDLEGYRQADHKIGRVVHVQRSETAVRLDSRPVRGAAGPVGTLRTFTLSGNRLVVGSPTAGVARRS